MASGIFPILNVSNLDKSHAFYKGLGLRIAKESAQMSPDFTMHWLTVGSGTEHAMMLVPREFPGADPEDVKWASGDVGKGILINLGVPNALKTHAKAKAAGMKVDELTPNPWGGHAFNVVDPDGYYLALSDRFPGSGTARRKPAKKAVKKSAAKKPAKASKKAAKKGGKKRR